VIGRLQLTYSTKLIHGIHIYHNQCGESRRVRVRNLGPIRPRRLRAGNMGCDTSPLPPPPPAPLSATPPPELAPRHNLRGQQGWWWWGAAFRPASGGVFSCWPAGWRSDDGSWVAIMQIWSGSVSSSGQCSVEGPCRELTPPRVSSRTNALVRS
jgi:hypothetical protein